MPEESAFDPVHADSRMQKKAVSRILREKVEDLEDLSDVLAVLENPGIPVPMSEIRKKYNL